MPDHVFQGSCHCGAIGFSFRTRARPQSWRVRACQCRFCRSHGARTTADPDGRVAFRITDERRLQRYRFALGTAEFFVCRTCGVYIAALLASPRGRVATLNNNAIGEPLDVADSAPASYDGESSGERRERRERQWTPVVDAL
jgi:hypothetical protein